MKYTYCNIQHLCLHSHPSGGSHNLLSYSGFRGKWRYSPLKITGGRFWSRGKKKNIRRNRNKERRRLNIHTVFIPDVISPPSQWKTRQCIGDKIYWVFFIVSELPACSEAPPALSHDLLLTYITSLTLFLKFFFFYFFAFNYSAASLWEIPSSPNITGWACSCRCVFELRVSTSVQQLVRFWSCLMQVM